MDFDALFTFSVLNLGTIILLDVAGREGDVPIYLGRFSLGGIRYACKNGAESRSN